MKVRAARRGDLADITLLADRLGLSSAEEVIAHAESVFEEPVSERQRMVIEDLFA
jgi:hypothetical protein